MTRSILHLKSFLDNCERVNRFVGSNTVDTFRANDQLHYAVILAIILIGEAVKQLPPELYDQHPGVPWHLIAKTRDRLVHGYLSIDLDRVWNMAVSDLPRLAVQVRDILAGLSNEDATHVH